MHNNALAILFALASALTIAWGTVVRHRIAEEVPNDDDGGAPILTVITKPLWWAGTFCALGGYGLQVIALAFGTLLVVQPILVLSLMFTLPLSARYDGRRVSLSEMTWAGLLTSGMANLCPHYRGDDWNGGPAVVLQRGGAEEFVASDDHHGTYRRV